jgi:ribosome-associated protein
VDRFRLILARALIEAPVRRPTRPGRASRERRLEAKRRRSEIKRWRRSVE